MTRKLIYPVLSVLAAAVAGPDRLRAVRHLAGPLTPLRQASPRPP